jgi:predicted nuclease of predicted toxin-antitoxin system
MRLLADAGISPATVAFLEQLGHDVVHVRAINMQRASDRAIADRATTDNRSVLTFDLDFGDVLALGVLDRPSVILLRVSNEQPEEINRRLSVVLSEQQAAIESGALILVEDTRYRVRKLPISPREAASSER